MVVFVTKIFYTYWNHCKYQAVHNLLYIFLNIIFNITLHSYILRNCLLLHHKIIPSLCHTSYNTGLDFYLHIIIPCTKLEWHSLYLRWICFYLIIPLFFNTLFILQVSYVLHLFLSQSTPFQISGQIWTLCKDFCYQKSW